MKTSPSSEDRPVLLLGASGMLGRTWRVFLDELQQPYDAPTPAECDFTGPETVAAAVSRRHGAVLNCAAYTDVDACETNDQRATAINGACVGVLARRCASLHIPLVHYSTDYVFDGSATVPYATTARRQPINAYGRSKALGEELVEAAGGRHLILRTSWLYAPWGKNFVRTIRKLSHDRQELRVVNDQIGRPTSCDSLVAASWQLLRGGAQGIFHVCDDGECSWFDLAREIVSFSRSACRVLPCSTAEYHRPARRPAYSVLDLSGTIDRIGPLPTWRQSLAQTIARLEPVWQ